MPLTRHLAVALVLVGLVALAGCSDEPSESYALGETVELEGNDTTIEVAVIDYRLIDTYEGTDESSGSAQTVTSPGDDQFLFVKVSVENVGDASGATPSVAVRPENESSSGEGPRPTWMTADRYRSVRSLDAGESRTGWVQTRVAGNVTASDVRVAFSPDILITGDEYKRTLREDT
jgi:hypothetical protein